MRPNEYLHGASLMWTSADFQNFVYIPDGEEEEWTGKLVRHILGKCASVARKRLPRGFPYLSLSGLAAIEQQTLCV
jgi:hypothetical protein